MSPSPRHFLSHFSRGARTANIARPLCTLLWAAAATGCGYVHHVPPGQSVAFAMAKKADVVSLPPSEQPNRTAASDSHAASTSENVEPQMPSASDTEKVADSFTLGNLFMEQGRYAEAITAYENAVKLNPSFADAWNNLAVAYQNTGQDKKALEAYRHFKSAALQ